MARKCNIEDSTDLGVFIKLTNSYCLVAPGASPHFYALLQKTLGLSFPVIKTTIGRTPIVGRISAANSHGLLLPLQTTKEEYNTIRKALPSQIKIAKIQHHISALGNCIACNDQVALIHPQFDEAAQKLIAEVLKVKVFRSQVSKHQLVGSVLVLNSKGAIVDPSTTEEEIEELKRILDVCVIRGTVNKGCDVVGSGLVVNDRTALCGGDTTAGEVELVESVFQLEASSEGNRTIEAH